MVIKFILTGVIIILLDALFLNFAGSGIRRMVATIQGKPLQVRYYAVMLSYLFAITALFYFVIMRKKGAKEGALLGFFIYATYDATNYALFREWSPSLALMDVLWGTVLFAVTAGLMKRIG